ncbi:hypothetical protein G9A89_003796 [Geosiphon pyriformis]|nr:hypothetical protein G9A89_003796 [Geosiphon pyriformis]
MFQQEGFLATSNSSEMSGTKENDRPVNTSSPISGYSSYSPINLSGSFLSKNQRKRTTVYHGDRFIPVRNADMFREFERLKNCNEPPKPKKRRQTALESEEQAKAELEHIRLNVLEKAMFPSRDNSDNTRSIAANLFAYQSTIRDKTTVIDTPSRMAYSTTPFSQEVENILRAPHKPPRVINSSPYQMLAFCDELTLKAKTSVYLWDASSSQQMTKLCELEDSSTIASAKWSPTSDCIAVGTADGLVQVWDAVKLMKIRDMSGHCARIGCLVWNGNILTSGSSDRLIFHRDLRCQKDFIRNLCGHKSEVCGLKWNNDGDQLASGGNANELFIWDRFGQTPIKKLDGHKAAVRALAWSPHAPNLLVSGGGHLDRQIKFWNTLDGKLVSSINTRSQVCNLAWSPRSNELVSTHGWWKNHIIVWDYPSLKKITTLKGHTYRVLYLSLSPNGEDIVTGSGGDDNTLRFWKVFNTPTKPHLKKESVFKIEGQIR